MRIERGKKRKLSYHALKMEVDMKDRDFSGITVWVRSLA